MRIVKSYSSGGFWVRHQENFNKLQKLKPYGVYILRDGSMPVYVGMGRIHKRVVRWHRSKTKKHSWDHFSWFEVQKRNAREVEALILRTLPYYLRNLNKQSGKLSGAKKGKEAKGAEPPKISHPRTNPLLRKVHKRKRKGD